jgi:hypothetical protein
LNGRATLSRSTAVYWGITIQPHPLGIIGNKIHMVIALRADLTRDAKSAAPLEPCIGFKELQRIPADEVDHVVDLCQRFFEDRAPIPGIVQEPKHALYVVLDYQLIRVAALKLRAVRGDGVDLLRLGGESGYQNQVNVRKKDCFMIGILLVHKVRK